ncbi:MAG: methanogenesis marker 14 protein [Candidatus Thorarchaeota archaeon]|jgi:putative methanogenesis marker protein 14
MTSKPKVIKPRTIGISSLKMGPFYTVASVELGNTTTKCILSATSLPTAEIFQIDKEVRFTREVRAPREGEKVFGHTIVGVDLTLESVSELVSDTLTTVLKRARIDIEEDLHFVVRSTGVNAGFQSIEEVGILVKALADGCLAAGIPPRKMTASISPDNLPEDIREFTWLKKVYFDGAVASSLPPANSEVVANEMEGELVTAGIKGAVKGSNTDFRNPALTLDFGTTLAGRITDDGYPYAKTIGSFAGFAGAIPDELIRGTGKVDDSLGCVLDIPVPRMHSIEIDEEWIMRIGDLIQVERVPEGIDRYGKVPVNPRAAAESDVILIGVDVGENGSDLHKAKQLGSEIYELEGLQYLLAAIDTVQANIVQRIITCAEESGLIYQNTSLGLTGRSVTTGRKPELISNNLRLMDGSLWIDNHQLVFVEDGLAMGAAVAARCMNSLGTRHNPMGGRKGDHCVMGARMKLQTKRNGSDQKQG